MQILATFQLNSKSKMEIYLYEKKKKSYETSAYFPPALLTDYFRLLQEKINGTATAGS